MSASERPESHSKRPRESLKSLKTRKMKEMQEATTSVQRNEGVEDPFSNAVASLNLLRGKTGIIYNLETSKHKCEWDEFYPESPKRLEGILKRCEEEELFKNCEIIPYSPRADLTENIIAVHSSEYYEKVKTLSTSVPLLELEKNCSDYDAIYINQHTLEAASIAATAVLNLVEAVATNEVQNGMALVRPPGHHAMTSECNGYCIFNNVAIAAEYCIKRNLAQKILIVDVDVHHGQGVQRMFYDRKDVLYFSIHRYEHGTFWPNLLESNFNYIGKGEGLGYNINVPLNTTGLTDDDYLTIVFSVLLPVAYEFSPDLIIVAGGYDAAIGCPEFNPQLVIVCGGYDSCMGDEKGRMKVTPGFYQHLVTLLSGLAEGRIAVCLEGGYFIPTLAEGVCMTIKGLLGMSCPPLNPIRKVDPSVVETICNVRRSLHKRWKCFDICNVIEPELLTGNDQEATYSISYYGQPGVPPYLTRNCYPKNSEIDSLFFKGWNLALREIYQTCGNLPVAYVYDDKLLKHTPQYGDIERPERPERIDSIMKMMKKTGVLERCISVEVSERDIAQYSPHTGQYLDEVDGKLKQTKDVYFNEHTQEVAKLAASSLLCLADAIMKKAAGSGFAIIRPPGHHAECDRALGFCILNNVAYLANYLQTDYDLQRILIVDFDVHHGNGTQNIFYNSNNVMYLSVHRDDNGKYFPANSPRQYTYDGYGCGKGYNVNIPFNKDKMGDTEYLAVFHNIILPIAYSYAPEVVIVSAGFDAGIYDPLGNYRVHPEMFGHFIQLLKPLANGKLIVVLEGGYNLSTTSYAMTICAKTLLGDPVVMPKNLYQTFSNAAVTTIRQVANHFKRYYQALSINKNLPLVPVLNKRVERFTPETYAMELSKNLDVERVHDSSYVEQEMKDFDSELSSLV